MTLAIPREKASKQKRYANAIDPEEQEKINTGFKKLDINITDLPDYQGAEQFASQFVPCSILKSCPVAYSDSTV